MKRIFTLISAVLLTATLCAQSQGSGNISYQSLIRDAEGHLLPNQEVGIRISILQGSADGTAVFVETHTPTTNANGLVSIAIGGGSTTADFSSIDWSNGPYFIKTEVDISGGTSYSITGVSQLLSVPYALHAKTAETVDSVSIDYSEVANTPDLSGYLSSELDGDPENEIQDLQLSGSTLSITNNSAATAIDLSTTFQPLNEHLTDLSDGVLSATKVENGTYMISSVGTDGQVWTSDGDEAGIWSDIRSIDNGLVINESGEAVDFRVEGDAQENLLFVEGSTDRIGIGTNNPYSILDIQSGDSDIDMTTYNDSDLSSIHIYRSRGNRLVPEAVQQGDHLGQIEFYMYDGNSWESGASIYAKADGGVSDGDIPTGLEFWTTPNGSDTQSRAMKIDEAGDVIVENDLYVWDDLKVSDYISTGENGFDGSVRIYSEQGNTDYVYRIQPHGAATQDVTLTLPADDGEADQVLSTDGAGNLSWADALPDGNSVGDMQYWDGTAWVVIAATQNEGATLQMIGGVPTWTGGIPSVVTGTGRVWMDRNLGATQVAETSTDADAYGDLYQWGRAADGHQLRTSGATDGSVQATTTVPNAGNAWDGLFIMIPVNSDWLQTPDDTLWQGVNGTNNPCPSDYRLPTAAECAAEIATWTSEDADGAFASPLQLPLAGKRFYDSSIGLTGEAGMYWTMSVGSSNSSLRMNIGSTYVNTYFSDSRATGYSVRCIKDW